MKKIAAGRALSALVVSLAAGAPALAHHSFAMFDEKKQVEIHGTVKEFLWTNPHSLLVLVSQDTAGGTVANYIEMNGPGWLVRNGWKRESLKPGDMITATIHPLRDGTPGGDLVKVVLADGHELSAAISLNVPSGAATRQAAPGEQQFNAAPAPATPPAGSGAQQ